MKLPALLGSLAIHAAVLAALVFWAQGVDRGRSRPSPASVRLVTSAARQGAPVVRDQVASAKATSHLELLISGPEPVAETAPAGPGPQTGEKPPEDLLPVSTAGPSPVPPATVPVSLVSFEKPRYPSRLRSLGVEGAVRLEAVVGADGKGRNFRVVGSSGYPEMDSRALDAFKKAVFAPRTVGTQPEESVFTLTVRFSLE